VTATVTIAGYLDMKMTRPELDRAILRQLDRTVTHLYTRQNMIDFKGLEERPKLKIDVEQALVEIHCAWHTSFDDDLIIWSSAYGKTVDLTWTGYIAVENAADLTGISVGMLRAHAMWCLASLEYRVHCRQRAQGSRTLSRRKSCKTS
jgi:hypothetical protein